MLFDATRVIFTSIPHLHVFKWNIIKHEGEPAQMITCKSNHKCENCLIFFYINAEASGIKSNTLCAINFRKADRYNNIKK